MPEGPELHLAAMFINRVSFARFFSGKVIKSAVSTRNPDIDWDENEYIINAVARGKEIKLTLENECEGEKKRKLDIVFRFGMSGRFEFEKECDLHKHAHLNFYTKTDGMVLSFVDYRRFGKWEPGGDWGNARGPCVISEYHKFRQNVLDCLDKAAFNKPICEVLLDQKYFNGVGNYLRAEILYRCQIPPFSRARDTLQRLTDQTKTEMPDVLQLCNLIPLEVVNLTGSMGYDPQCEDDYDAFKGWLQCYYKADMNNMVDHNGRTMWFKGPPGPLTPTAKKTRGRQKATQKKVKPETEDEITIKKDDVKPHIDPKYNVCSDEETVKSERITRSRVKEKAAGNKTSMKTKVKVKKIEVHDEAQDNARKTGRRKRRGCGETNTPIEDSSLHVSPYFRPTVKTSSAQL